MIAHMNRQILPISTARSGSPWPKVFVLIMVVCLVTSCYPTFKVLKFETAEGRTKLFEVRSSNGDVVATCKAEESPFGVTGKAYTLHIGVELFTDVKIAPSSFDPNTVSAWFNNIRMTPEPHSNSGEARVLDNGTVSTWQYFHVRTYDITGDCLEPGEKFKGEIKIYINDLLRMNGLESDIDTLRINREFKCPN